MGRRGPPPKPTRLKVLAGNPGRRPLNPREPKPAVDTPACPAWLSPAAKRVWRHTVPLLRNMGVLARADRDALAAYCQTYARWREAEEFLQQRGAVYAIKDERGKLKFMAQFPQVSIAKSLLQVVRGYQQEFGLTPSARTRLEVEPIAALRRRIENDPFEQFLNQRHRPNSA